MILDIKKSVRVTSQGLGLRGLDAVKVAGTRKMY